MTRTLAETDRIVTIRETERFFFTEEQGLSVLAVVDTNARHLVVAPVVSVDGVPSVDLAGRFQVMHDDVEPVRDR